MNRWARVVIAGGLVAAPALAAQAHSVRVNPGPASLSTTGPTAGRRAVPTAGPHVGSHGSTVLVDAQGLLVAERNAGMVVRADATGTAVARLALHEGLGEIVGDGHGRVFVADRRGDRVVEIDASSADALTEVGAIDLGEPYGLARTPDGATLLVTSVAEHELVAIDTATRTVRWRAELTAEPRGVAVSADGRHATVGFVSSGSLAVVDLHSARAGEAPRVRWHSLDPRDPVEIDREEDEWSEGMIEVAVIREARSRFEVPVSTGRRRARNVFAVGYVGHGLVVAPHQLSTSQMKRIPSAQMADSYGGGPETVPPIVHQLAIVAGAGTTAARPQLAHLNVHQPRAIAYDAARDTLYVGGYGDDEVQAIADVSQPSAWVAWTASLSRNDPTRPDTCGVDGIAVDGDKVWIHCEIGRNLVALSPDEVDLTDKEWRREKRGVAVGPELAPTLRSEAVERGAELFRRGGDWRMSDRGVMACASCHPEGRQDGLSWRLGKSILQTPMLAGRVVGTAPYKWDGQDADLPASFRHTIERLGGPEGGGLRSSEYADLAAYLESLPAPRAPHIDDPEAVARGKALFRGDLDCATCHDGARFTDGQQYPLQSRGLDTTDTPSLVGVAHTAPYYHDGSAQDLHALLTDKGSVHDMAELSDLTATQVADLTAFLRSL